MMWFAQWENKSQPFSSLRKALQAWGLSHWRGRRVDDGVYMITASGGDVRFIRADKLQQWSVFVDRKADTSAS